MMKLLISKLPYNISAAVAAQQQRRDTTHCPQVPRPATPDESICNARFRVQQLRVDVLVY